MDAARRAGRLYNYLYSRLGALGLTKNDSEFKKLDLQNDLRIKNPAAPRNAGDTDRRDPWYWSAGMPANVERSEWLKECRSSI